MQRETEIHLATNKSNIILYSLFSFILHVRDLVLFLDSFVLYQILLHMDPDCFYFPFAGQAWLKGQIRDSCCTSSLPRIFITTSTAGRFHLTPCLSSKLAQKLHEGRVHEGKFVGGRESAG